MPDEDKAQFSEFQGLLDAADRALAAGDMSLAIECVEKIYRIYDRRSVSGSAPRNKDATGK